MKESPYPAETHYLILLLKMKMNEVGFDLTLSAAGIGNELGLSGKIIDFAGPIQITHYSWRKSTPFSKDNFSMYCPCLCFCASNNGFINVLCDWGLAIPGKLAILTRFYRYQLFFAINTFFFSFLFMFPD